MNWLRRNIIIVFLALVKLLLPFIIVDSSWELHRDEYLYYQQGQHLAAGYLENPSLIAVLSQISSWFGGTEFSIRLWPALIGAITLIVTSELTGELGGGRFAKTVAALGILFSAFMRIHFLFQPNMLDVLCWLSAAWFLVRYINRNHSVDLYLMCISLALGWWSKYSIAFFIAALMISLLLTPQRRIFRLRHFWLAALLAVVIITPNLVWQYQQNWPLMHHMTELRDTQLRYLSKTTFLKEQVLLLLPVVFVWLGGLYWLLRNKTYRVLGYTYILVISLLMLGSGKGYYALGAYPMLLAAGGVWLERASAKRHWLRYATVSLILMASLPLVPVLLPSQSAANMAAFNQRFGLKEAGLLRWEDQRDHILQQDYADMRGWKEMASATAKFFNGLPDTAKQQTIIYCRNYGQAGALRYYGKDVFGSKVITDNGSFLLWIPDNLPFKHLLFIGEEMPGTDDVVFNHFKSHSLIDSVRDPLSRSFGTKVIFYQDADSAAVPLARQGLAELKKRFRR